MAENVIRNDVIKLDFDIGNSLKELKKLQDDVNELKKKLTGGIGEETFEELGENAEESIKPIKKVKEEAEKLKTTLSDLGNKAAKAAYNGLKKVASISFKALSVGIAGAATAISGLVAKSVTAYADFEQLKGGVETLFKDSAGTVQRYANDAYKTAGLSANEYMETVTSFSASLIASCNNDTAKAAEYANMAISDMSDNANKMGTDMGSIQYAYQGFAKQNYTMLDNLKLGYGGTKTEMERLIKDASKLDKSVKANDMSFGNIVKAIHAVQVNMDIYGTTSKEAEKTITGSLNAMKSSWGNLLTAMASGENLDQCIDNMISSVEIFADNVMPVAEKALGGIGTAIEKLVPIISKKLPSLADKLLPPLIKAAIELTKGLVKALPSILKTVASTVVDILTEQFAPLGKLGNFFAKNSKQIKSFATVIVGLVGALLAFKKLGGIASIFSSLGGGKGGGKGGGMSGFFESLAKMKTTTVLKGVGNLTIILGALMGLTAILAALAPKIAGLSDGKSLFEVIAVMTALGALGAVLSKEADLIGKIKIKTVLKGLVNMGIMLVGIGALTALCMLVAPKIAPLASGGDILKVVGVMALLGVVGGALAVFAGIVGMIPIPVVLAGLANMALVLGGFGLIATAFGALNQIPGLQELIQSGGELLSTLCGILGEMVGSLIGGLAEGITNALPGIATNLAAFAENLKPVFTAFEGANVEAAGNALLKIGEFLLLMGANDILSFFTGGTDFASIGEGLATLAGDGTKKFLNFVSGFEEQAFINAEKFFVALSYISKLPNSGGIASWFGGENDYSGVAEGLGQLSGQNVKNFFSMVNGMKETAFTNAEKFFKSLDGIGSLPNTGGFFQLFTGKNDFAGVVSGLTQLAGQGVKDFFTFVKGLKETAFTNAERFFKALDYVSLLPNAGGFASWGGKNDFSGVAKGLGELSTDKVKRFFTMVGELDPKTFEKTQLLFTAIGKIADINKEGMFERLGEMFLGEDNNLGEIATQLQAFWNKTKKFFTEVGNVKDASNFGKVFDSIKKAETIKDVDISNLPAKGTALSNFATNAKTFLNILIAYKEATFEKIPQFTHIFTTIERAGKVASIDLSSLPAKGKQMSEFATNVIGFFTTASVMKEYLQAANELITVLNNFFSAIKRINSVDLPEFKGGVDTIFDGVVATVENSVTIMIDLISEMPSKMGTAIKNNSHYLSDSVKSMWEDAVKTSATPVNKLLDGANFVLKEFGAEQTIAKWTPYAKGTGGHKGGNALVNDGRGAELVQMPNGRTFIPNGRNVLMPNAPKGMKVLSAENTAKLLGRGSPTFRYAEGTGGIDVWSFIDNADGLIGELKKGLTYGNGFGGSAGKGMVNTVSGAMKPWLEKVFEEYGVKGLEDYVASAGVEQWKTTVARALKMEGLYSAANVKRTLFQMQTESGGNPRAINNWDINAKNGTPSKGLMQVIDPTFSAYARAGYNKNIYDPLSNILASVRYATSRYGSLAKAYRGVGYSNGIGEVTIPSTSGSLNMSYTPSSSYSGGKVVNETNHYSPTFNLTLNGTGNDRDTERKVKRWIKEAMEDMFAGMDSKNRLIREV